MSPSKTSALVYLVFYAVLVCQCFGETESQEELRFLTERTQSLLQGCRTKAHDGTIIYTPDGKANYAALWTRDFAYMVENAGDLMPREEIEGCLKYILRHQRPDGAVPDRVQPDGTAVYSAGPANAPVGDANLDNPMFLVIAVDEYLKHIDRKTARTLFQNWSETLDKGMDYISRSENGLVFNNPAKPHSPYGFTDCIGKTGELFMESLLYWTACERLEKWHRKNGNTAKAKDYNKRAQRIEKNVGALFDNQKRAFLAASIDCRQIDLWANAYAVQIHFPLGKERNAVLSFLVDHYSDYVWHGQVRHLLAGQYWQRFLAPIAPERYQNGAYWATASGWVMTALAEKKPMLAHQMFHDLISDFKQGGTCECVNKDYRQLESYVASGTNPLAAARKLFK